MGVLSRNAEHSIARLVWTGPVLFLNHAGGGDSTDKRLQTWFGVIKQSMVNHDDPNPPTRACSSLRHTSHRPMILLQKKEVNPFPIAEASMDIEIWLGAERGQLRQKKALRTAP
jgi:hypothetical protein